MTTLSLNLIPIILLFYYRIPFPFSRVREYGLGIWVFLSGYWCMRFRVGFFYVVVYGSSSGSIMWVLGIGCYGFGSLGELFLRFYL